jgi:phosphoglycolate phosphatase-like HAD superfamily hydrolase
MKFAGMTDPAIVRAGLVAARHATDDATIERVLERYLTYLPLELSATPPRVHLGVVELIAWLANVPDVAIGLGTGNVEPGAQHKLSAAALWDHFGFGGYGSDHEDRAELIRIGAGRGAAALGRAPDACEVVVIGDTPRDVAAAQAIGARSLGVGTAWHDAGSLAACGATWAVDDLTDPAVESAFRQALRGP